MKWWDIEEIAFGRDLIHFNMVSERAEGKGTSKCTPGEDEKLLWYAQQKPFFSFSLIIFLLVLVAVTYWLVNILTSYFVFVYSSSFEQFISLPWNVYLKEVFVLKFTIKFYSYFFDM